MPDTRLSHQELLRMKRWNTPTIYNGWEAVTKRDRTTCFNREPLVDYMPWMGPMVGYAITVVVEPGNSRHPAENPGAWDEYRRYVASIEGPKIVVVQDLDKPVAFGAFWGEVNSNAHRALGCVGTITDGAVRDVDEMSNAGFKALARCMCVGHAWSTPVRWGCPVEVFGCEILPGQLIHADRHGFLAIPQEDEARVLEAADFMDANECETVIAAARSASGKSSGQILEALSEAGKRFDENRRRHFGSAGEWK